MKTVPGTGSRHWFHSTAKGGRIGENSVKHPGRRAGAGTPL